MCQELHGNKGHYLKDNGVNFVGIIRSHQLKGFPLDSTKDLTKQEGGSHDYDVDLNSCVTIVCWMNNSIVQLASSFVGVNPVFKIESCVNVRIQIDCWQIALHSPA